MARKRKPKSLGRLFKGGGVEGQSPPRIPQDAKSFFCRKAQERRKPKSLGRLFKGGGVEGQSPPRIPQDVKSFFCQKAQERRKTSRWDVLRGRTLAGGSPMGRKPHRREAGAGGALSLSTSCRRGARPPSNIPPANPALAGFVVCRNRRTCRRFLRLGGFYWFFDKRKGGAAQAPPFLMLEGFTGFFIGKGDVVIKI